MRGGQHAHERSVENLLSVPSTPTLANTDQAFSTPHEPNAAIAQKVADYKAAPLQKREGSRRIVFGEVEPAFLVPPPEVQFEVCDWVCGRAADLNLRVVSDKSRYSVP